MWVFAVSVHTDWQCITYSVGDFVARFDVKVSSKTSNCVTSKKFLTLFYLPVYNFTCKDFIIRLLTKKVRKYANISDYYEKP